MLTIDGSHLEGGGQILRTSLALSSLLGEPFKIVNIRSNRPKPGLRPQHLSAVYALAQITDAELDGARIGSTELTFNPGKITGGDYEFDIGTAGSTTLLMQAILPVLIHSKETFNITVKGGTHVMKSPTYEYFEHAFLDNLRFMGARVQSFLIRPGFYPQGGGEVQLTVKPSNMKSHGFLDDGYDPTGIYVYITSANLPRHVNEREGKFFMKKGIPDVLDHLFSDTPSTGNSITVVAKFNDYVVGVDKLGEVRKPAEKVARDAYNAIMEEITTPGVDANMVDQLLIYLALYGGSMTYHDLTSHAKTNMHVVEQFLDKKFDVTDNLISVV